MRRATVRFARADRPGHSHLRGVLRHPRNPRSSTDGLLGKRFEQAGIAGAIWPAVQQVLVAASQPI
jgi:hypothetical protein